MNSSLWLDKFKIIAVFVMLSVITSGAGVYVLQAINVYHASALDAGSLESYQNFTNIAASFFMFSILIKFGYRKSIVICAAIMTIFCAILPLWNDLWAIRVYLILVGVSVTLIKVSAYSAVSLVVKNEKEHASFINMMEAIYTLGSVCGVWVFAYFIGTQPENWTRSFWVFSIVCGLVCLLWWFTPFRDLAVDTKEQVSIKSQLKSFWPIILTSTTVIFLILLFSSEMLEQGVGSWLPTFYHSEFMLSPSFSVKMASAFTISMFAGRVFGAILLRYVRWDNFFVLNFFVGFILMALALFTIPTISTTIISWGMTPWNAYALASIGFFLGPIYPTICSSLLSSQPKHLHAILMSFVMIFTALFDSISSKLLGVLIYMTTDITAFMVTVLPPFLIFAFLIVPYYKIIHKNNVKDNMGS